MIFDLNNLRQFARSMFCWHDRQGRTFKEITHWSESFSCPEIIMKVPLKTWSPLIMLFLAVFVSTLVKNSILLWKHQTADCQVVCTICKNCQFSTFLPPETHFFVSNSFRKSYPVRYFSSKNQSDFEKFPEKFLHFN